MLYLYLEINGRPGSVSASGGLKQLVGVNLESIDAREVNSLPIVTSADGRQVVVRVGRYGPYLERPTPDGEGTERANLPDELAPDEVTAESVEELFAKSGESSDRVLGTAPDTGFPVVAKDGRYGPYVTEQLPDDVPTKGKGAVKPRTASLFKTMNLNEVDLDDALRLLTLPRVVGVAADGEEITAQNGRYGPYLKKGTDSRSLTDEEELFTVGLDQALAIYAQPKTRGRSAATAPPLRELGEDPVTKKPMVIKEGRFGPYVTDGETNASLRKGDEVATLTVERGAELLSERRARGPAPKRTPTRSASGSTGTRRTTRTSKTKSS